jgi:L-threonylcarbamoyladenylate synthase
MLTADDAVTFERVMAGGGVAVFPADTVYGLACDPSLPDAVDRLYAIKGRPPVKPSAVMLFSVDLALATLPDLHPREAAALEALLPGGVTVLLPNPSGLFPLACASDPGTLGVRVPGLPPAAAALHAVRRPVLQSSANLTGGAEARRASDVDPAVRMGADLVLDGGELAGTASTIVDLRAFATDGDWSIVRPGVVPGDVVESALDGL